MRRGPGPVGVFDLGDVFDQAYGGSYEEDTADYSTAGPLWFRKMDRNRDGDVSPIASWAPALLARSR